MKAQDNRPTEFLLPPQITQAQLTSLKKKYKFSEIAQLGFGLAYKSRWDTWSAIREFVQNALDVITENHGDRESLQKVILDYQGHIGYIIDSESGIKYRNMFLAENKEHSKGSDCLRGKFGEGMKFALIPLLREGHAVTIRTVGYDYHFSSVIMENDDFDLIHLFQIPNKITTGTCIAISGVDPTIYRDRFIPLRLAQKPDDLLIEQSKGCKIRHILKKADLASPGRFYIRDIFICEIESLYDYNFWFTNPAKVLDPDRNSIKLSSGTIESFLVELVFLLQSIASSGSFDFWKQFFGDMLTSKKLLNIRPIDLFEYRILDHSSNHDCRLRFPEPEILFNCLADVLGTRSFGWSQDYHGGKELEHHDVMDLQDKLPDLSHWLRDYVLTPEKINNLRRLEVNNEIIILPEDFAPLGDKAVDAIKNAYMLLHHITFVICEELNTLDDPPYVYLYVGGGRQDKRIARVGHTNYETINLSWEPIQNMIRLLQRRGHPFKGRRGRRRASAASLAKRRLKHDARDAAQKLIKTLLHELSHYCCNQQAKEYGEERECGDLTQGFEDAMEDVMMAYSTVRVDNFHGYYSKLNPALDTTVEAELTKVFVAAQKDLLQVKEIEDAWASATNRLERQNYITLMEDQLTEGGRPISWKITASQKQNIQQARKDLIKRALRRRTKT